MRKSRTERWLTRRRGLSTSSIAVPIIVRLTTTTATATPGGTIAHQAPTLMASRANAFWISRPHEVTLGSPSPRKAIAVSAKIAYATMITAVATSSGATCGSTWRRISRVFDAPTTRVRRM